MVYGFLKMMKHLDQLLLLNMVNERIYWFNFSEHFYFKLVFLFSPFKKETRRNICDSIDGKKLAINPLYDWGFSARKD